MAHTMRAQAQGTRATSVTQVTHTGPADKPSDQAAVDSAVGNPAAANPAVANPAVVDPIAAELGEELVRFFRLMQARKQRSRAEHGGGDRVLLAVLARCGPRRATDLAADAHLDLSTVSRQVRSLVERGLVERTPDPDDRRGALLSVSASGLVAFEAFREQRNRELSALLENWTGEDREQLVRLLSRLNDEFARHHTAEQGATK